MAELTKYRQFQVCNLQFVPLRNVDLHSSQDFRLLVVVSGNASHSIGERILCAGDKPTQKCGFSGDLVNFGVNPAEIIEFVKGNAAVVIRGSHDQAVGYDEEPRCIPRYQLSLKRKIAKELLLRFSQY